MGDFTRERPAVEVRRSVPRERVVRVLDPIDPERRLPQVIVLENAPSSRTRLSTDGPTTKDCGYTSFSRAGPSRKSSWRVSTGSSETSA